MVEAAWPDEPLKVRARALGVPPGTLRGWLLKRFTPSVDKAFEMARNDAALRAEMIAALRGMECALDGLEADRLARRHGEGEGGGRSRHALDGNGAGLGARGAGGDGVGRAPARGAAGAGVQAAAATAGPLTPGATR